MSYIVVYQREDGSSGVEECADLDLAVVTAERLRNVDAVERPRIFKTEEITYDFKPYYRVEVTSAASTAAAATASAAAPVAESAPAAEEPAAAETSETVDAEPSAPSIVEQKIAEKKAAAAEQAAGADTADAVEESADAKDSDSRSGLFTGAMKSTESVEESTVSELPEVESIETESDAVPPRRGLFGR